MPRPGFRSNIGIPADAIQRSPLTISFLRGYSTLRKEEIPGGPALKPALKPGASTRRGRDKNGPHRGGGGRWATARWRWQRQVSDSPAWRGEALRSSMPSQREGTAQLCRAFSIRLPRSSIYSPEPKVPGPTLVQTKSGVRLEMKKIVSIMALVAALALATPSFGAGQSHRHHHRHHHHIHHQQR